MEGNMKAIKCLPSVLLLVGCGVTIDFAKNPNASDARVVVLDERPVAERVRYRDGAAPVIFMGDENFSVPPLDTFTKLVESRLPGGSYEMKVTKFRVIDILPRRLAIGTSVAVAGALGSLGYVVPYLGTGSLSEDNITCVVGGEFQSRTMSASYSVPYRLPLMTGLVKKEPVYLDAIYLCLDNLAESVAKGQ